MDQPTFADLEYDSKKRKTRREIFLERMDSLIPWERLEERIRPFYPKAGRGRRPYEPGFPILGVFRLKGQSKRDGSIIVRSCKASLSPLDTLHKGTIP